jgi:hypothetical protein
VITRPVVTRQLAPNQPPGPTVREGLAWTSAPASTAKPLGNPEAHVRPACAGRRHRSRHAGGAWVAVKVSDRHHLSPPSLPALVTPAQGKRSSGASHPPRAGSAGWWLELDRRRRHEVPCGGFTAAAWPLSPSAILSVWHGSSCSLAVVVLCVVVSSHLWSSCRRALTVDRNGSLID